MALSLYAMNEGYFDEVDVKGVVKWEGAMQSYVKSNFSEMIDSINADGDYNDDIAANLAAALDDFKKNGSV
jgi:F-type H+-transporting ATPase subunit alpha